MKQKKQKPEKRRTEFLADYVPYLLNRLTREMLRGVDQRFQERGLTVSKWRVLAILADRGKCGFGELARLTSIEPPTLSRFINALSREGLIRRRRSSVDARTVTITLTEKGELTFEGTIPWALDVQNTLLRGVASKDAVLLQKILKQMYQNIHAEFADADEETSLADDRLLES